MCSIRIVLTVVFNNYLLKTTLSMCCTPLPPLSRVSLSGQAVGGGKLAHVRPLRLRLPVLEPEHLRLPPPVPGAGEWRQGNGCHGDGGGVVLLLPSAGGKVLNAPPLAGESGDTVNATYM